MARAGRYGRGVVAAVSAETHLLPLPEGDKAWEYMGGTTVFSGGELKAYALANLADLQREVESLRSLLVPGLRVYEGDHVVQVAVGPRLFTSRYVDEDDKPRALRHAIATACAALSEPTP